jgi:diacylglycerol kinase (ATP)
VSAMPAPAAEALRVSRQTRHVRPVARQSDQLVLVANGSASGLGGSRKTLDDARRALGRRGVRVETHLTESVGELAETWPSFEDRRVVLLGGDGTLHAAANLPVSPEIALLPAGRANNVARALGIPLDLAAAADLAAAGRARPIDLIAAENGGRRYLAVEGVSVGLHALARSSYQAPNSADVRAAIRSGFRAARQFDGVVLCVSSDGAQELLTVGQLFATNLSLYAFGLRVAPQALPDDGLLDVVALPWEGRARIVSTLAQLRRGTHLGRRGTRAWTAGRVRIATRGHSPIIADTTNLGSGPVMLEVVPGALPVVRP